MAKALRTAAFVVGAVALVASGVGAAAGVGLFGAVVAGSATAAALASIATVATIASVAAGVLSLAAATVGGGSPKGSVGGNPSAFKIDKDAGIPIVFGRTYVGGNVVHRQYYGTKNSLESWVTVLSMGPVNQVGPLLIDKAEVTFIGGAASGTYNGFMWLDTQLGACPEARALAGPQGPFPGWDATSKISGLAADLWTLKFDTNGKTYPNGVPQRGRVIEGVLAWDPRLDDTVVGGAGPCRADDPSTHLYTENPWLLGLWFALGAVQNRTLMAGGGLPITGIDLTRWIEAANYADLVGWKAGGLVYTTADNDWDILKMLAQAGGGEVMPIGALLSCTFSAPRVSIGTIASEDIAGDIDVPSTASMRTRRNTVIPRVRLESHGWEVVPLDAISVAEYVGEDSGTRPKEIVLPLVQDVDLGAKLSVLQMLDDRELDGIVLPLKIYALGYLPGDCLTADLPEANLFGRDVVVRTREIDAASLGVTLTCRSETPGKHPFALGQSGTPPRTPDLSIPTAYPADNLSAIQLAIATSFPIGLTITAADDGTITISDHTRRYTDGHADVAVDGATISSGLAAGDFRAIGYDDFDRIGGAVANQLFVDDLDARASPDHPGRHYVGYATIPTAGSPPADGGGASPPGGNCVTIDTPLLAAPGVEKPAGEWAVGERVYTRHEVTLEWGFFPVEAFMIVDSEDVWSAEIGGRPLSATGDHLVYTGAWIAMRAVPGATQIAGTQQVVKMTVTGAHTYVSNGVLSHNIKQNTVIP